MKSESFFKNCSVPLVNEMAFIFSRSYLRCFLNGSMVEFFISLLNEFHNTGPLKEIEFLPISVRYLGILSV